ncbi:type I restriction-modification system subunit M [Mycolicibacterium novocastrense]|nr:type I restriction-modification system subunit M [Mycolicibacterium novocastrense]
MDADDEDAAAALQSEFGARPTVEFVQEAWPTLLESWLRTAAHHRERVVQALQEARHEKGTIRGSRAQMTYLRSLRNSKGLREAVWRELIAAGEQQPFAGALQQPKVQTRKRSKLSTPRPPEALPTSDTATVMETHVARRQKKPQQEKSLEATLWEAADRLRSRVDAAEYKHVVLGLIFLKYVSDVFTKRRDALQRLVDDADSDYFMPTQEAKRSVLEDRDEYTSEGVFWMPEGHRWDDLRKTAKQTDIGERIDAAMDAIEKENPSLRGVLPKRYARRELTPAMLGGLIDTFSRKDLAGEEHKGLDVLGRVYEYFLGKFATAEGKLGGEFYTPRSVVRLMVEMLEPFNGRVFDPACGSGGMFVQAEEFVEAHGGRRTDISVFGQEQNPTTWRLAKMNLALRGIDANLGPEWGDSFLHDHHPDLRADFILTNPPFNVSEWGGERLRDDPRWKYGIPPVGNANFAWIQHMLAHLSPSGTMVTVLANGSLSSQQSGEGEIRRNLVDEDLVECIVALPSQLFYTTQIPVCLWFLTRDKSGDARQIGASVSSRRQRLNEVLFIDARTLGHMVSRTNRELAEPDIAQIANTYHAWRGENEVLKPYEDIAGFCAAVPIEHIRHHQYVLQPGRYVGSVAAADDGEPLDQKIARITNDIRDGFTKRAELRERVLFALDSLRIADDA